MHVVRRASAVSSALASFFLALSSPVAAQSPDDEARALFEQGVDLADHGDWTTAIERFEAAVALHDAPAIRFNLAQSLTRLGRLTDALAHLEALERGGTATAAIRASANELRAEIEPRIGRLVVRVRGDVGDDCSVEVGARTLAPTELGAPVALDPGPARVRLICGRAIADEVDIAVPEGGSSNVLLGAAPTPVDDEVADVAAASAPSAPSAPVAPSGGSDLASEPWLWVVVGIVVVGAAAGITAGVLVATSEPALSQGDFAPMRLEFGR